MLNSNSADTVTASADTITSAGKVISLLTPITYRSPVTMPSVKLEMVKVEVVNAAVLK